MMRILLSTLLLTILTACSTLTADSDQPISIVTTPAGASCELTNAQGSWKIAQTPGTISVKRSFSPLVVACHKGTLSAEQTLEPSTRNRAYGNLLMLGVPAVVDAGTGDGYEYTPDIVDITLKDSGR